MLVRWIWNWLFNQIWEGLPKKARWGLAALLAGFIIWLLFMPNLHPIPTDTSIEGRSHINRYINHFWVNGQGGGNVDPYGGGGIVCCQRIRGDNAEVEWVYGRTVEEYERGDEPERHRVTLPMPKRNREDRYLHVHFLPNNEVRLGWSPDLVSPYNHLPKRPSVARYQE